MTPPPAPTCLWCDEPILPSEAIGFGQIHYECGLRSVVGSVGHQMGLCYCYGGSYEDPPGMTRRQAALAAAAYHNHGTVPPTP